MKQGILYGWQGCALHKGPVSEEWGDMATSWLYMLILTSVWQMEQRRLSLTCTKTRSGPVGTPTGEERACWGFCRHPGKICWWLGLGSGCRNGGQSEVEFCMYFQTRAERFATDQMRGVRRDGPEAFVMEAGSTELSSPGRETSEGAGLEAG